MTHIPVLQKEVLQYLDPKPNENFIDCTFGEGGHTLAILEKNGPDGKVLGIDADQEQIENCKLKIENFNKRVSLVCDNFANLKEIVEREKFRNISGILLDLGLCGRQLEKSGKGFSFQKQESLDMRYGQTKLTAEWILNYYSFQELEKILREYGQERFSERIASEIIKTRKIKPITRTFQLIEVLKRAVPSNLQHQKINFATKTFQALRIAVNDELNSLEIVLPQAIELLRIGGRLVVISFHSLEDRIVKNFINQANDKNIIKILTKKPVVAQKQEIIINNRCRSAKLRAAERIN